MKLRQIFYTQIELRTFHTVWTNPDIGDGSATVVRTPASIGLLAVVAEPTHVVAFAPEAHFTCVTPGGDQVPSSTSALGQ
jgi:hypothetical protein